MGSSCMPRAPGAGVRREASLFGRQVTVQATGTVSAVDGQLVIEPETVDLGGPDLVDGALSAAARRLVTIRTPSRASPTACVWCGSR